MKRGSSPALQLLALGAAALSGLAAAEPNTCQPRSRHPFMPIYHIIGNVTSSADGGVRQVEAINDVSSAFLYKGIYHVFHQCCQNHWDHVVSHDLVHWTRLPPPIVPNMNPTGVPHPDWYDAHGSWDGSLSIPRDASSFPGGNGITEPVVLMTAVPGPAPPNTPPTVKDHITMAIVRPTEASDPFLLNWTKDANNPIHYKTAAGAKGTISTPFDTPGQIWKNGDHWNYLVMGNRYTTKDPTFLSWGLAPGKSSFASRENGGQWFSKIANLKDGSCAPSSPALSPSACGETLRRGFCTAASARLLLHRACSAMLCKKAAHGIETSDADTRTLRAGRRPREHRAG